MTEPFKENVLNNYKDVINDMDDSHDEIKNNKNSNSPQDQMNNSNEKNNGNNLNFEDNNNNNNSNNLNNNYNFNDYYNENENKNNFNDDQIQNQIYNNNFDNYYNANLNNNNINDNHNNEFNLNGNDLQTNNYNCNSTENGKSNNNFDNQNFNQNNIYPSYSAINNIDQNRNSNNNNSNNDNLKDEEQEGEVDLGKYFGDNNFENNKNHFDNNNDYNFDNIDNYNIQKEEILNEIPQQMDEIPQNSNKMKDIISDNLKNNTSNKETQNNEKKKISKKNNNKKINNISSVKNNEEKSKSKNKDNKVKKENKYEKANNNVLSFAEMLKKKQNNGKNSVNKKISQDNKITENKNSKKISINFNGRLYQPKKNYSNDNNQHNENQKNNKNKTVNDLKPKYKNNKSQSKSNETQRKNKNEDQKKIVNNYNKNFMENKTESVQEFLNKHKNKNTTKKINNIKQYEKPSINKNTKKVSSKNSNVTNVIDFISKKNTNNQKDISPSSKINRPKSSKKYIQKNIDDLKHYTKIKQNNRYNKIPKEDTKNSNIQSARKAKSVRKNITKKYSPSEDTGVPLNITKNEVSQALVNGRVGQNVSCDRYSPDKSPLHNYDNSKYKKYDIEQMKYELIKDYCNIHPNKSEPFLQRMQFDAYKRKTQDKNLEYLIDRNKNKLNENIRKDAFDRLLNDANRRKELKQEIIKKNEELENEEIKNTSDKKYNENEWEAIYNVRFKNYSNYLKEKIDLKRKIVNEAKLRKENEEKNKYYQFKKIPQYQVNQISQRLYNDSKKRNIKKNVKNCDNNNFRDYKSYFDEDDDASKYMKNYKKDNYNFYDSFTNSSNNNEYRNMLNNGGAIPSRTVYMGDRKIGHKISITKLKKPKNMTVTDFNNKRFDTKGYFRKLSNNKNNIGKNRTVFYNKNNYMSEKDNYSAMTYLNKDKGDVLNIVEKNISEIPRNVLTYTFNRNNFDENDNYYLNQIQENMMQREIIKKMNQEKEKMFKLSREYYEDELIGEEFEFIKTNSIFNGRSKSVYNFGNKFLNTRKENMNKENRINDNFSCNSFNKRYMNVFNNNYFNNKNYDSINTNFVNDNYSNYPTQSGNYNERSNNNLNKNNYYTDSESSQIIGQFFFNHIGRY